MGESLLGESHITWLAIRFADLCAANSGATYHLAALKHLVLQGFKGLRVTVPELLKIRHSGTHSLGEVFKGFRLTIRFPIARKVLGKPQGARSGRDHAGTMPGPCRDSKKYQGIQWFSIGFSMNAAQGSQSKGCWKPIRPRIGDGR